MNTNEEQIEALISAIRSISHGDNHGPMGLEGVTMALAAGVGDKLGNQTVAGGLYAIADSIETLSEAIREMKN